MSARFETKAGADSGAGYNGGVATSCGRRRTLRGKKTSTWHTTGYSQSWDATSRRCRLWRFFETSMERTCTTGTVSSGTIIRRTSSRSTTVNTRSCTRRWCRHPPRVRVGYRRCQQVTDIDDREVFICVARFTVKLTHYDNVRCDGKVDHNRASARKMNNGVGFREMRTIWRYGSNVVGIPRDTIRYLLDEEIRRERP